TSASPNFSWSAACSAPLLLAGFGFRRLFRLCADPPGRGLRPGGRLRRLRLLFLPGLVGFAALLVLVEAGALDQQGRSRPEEPPELLCAAFRALRQRWIGDALQLIDRVMASVAFVFVGWHSQTRLLRL